LLPVVAVLVTLCWCQLTNFYASPHVSFSVFEEMHPTLLSAHVGDLTMKVVDLESRRHSARMQELRRLARLAEAQARGDTELEAKIRAGEDEPE